MPDPTLQTLVDDLASPDPAVRDEHALPALTTLVGDGGIIAGDRAWLASALLDRLGHERAEARTFAPLVLAALVEAGHFDPGWVPAVTRWYVGEQDLRGHDRQVGWVHAVAHGADFFGTCGAAGVGDPSDLLGALAQRLVTPTTVVWRDQEEDRVALALALVLSRDDVDEATAVGWLAPARALFASCAPGPVPAEASNTMRALRSLHVALGQQVLSDGQPVEVPHAAVVRRALTVVLGEVTPWFWEPASRDESVTPA